MFIDLSVKLNESTPAYPGDPKIDIKETGKLDAQGYCGHRVTLGTHTGTHIDAPSHMVEGGKNLGHFSLETFIGNAKCIDVTTGYSIDKCSELELGEGDIVLLLSGMSKRYYEPEYFTDYPVMTNEFADYLVDKKVKMVGLDTCSADKVGGFPIHKKLLGEDILIIENLTNLEHLPQKGFTLFALPLSLNLDGAPARVIARIDK